jgi:hypothetical protein
MRNCLFVAAIVFGSVTSFPAGPAAAQENASQRVALNNYSAPLGNKPLKTPRPKGSQTAQYCGQCTDSSQCGVGFVCCPMNNCPSNAPNGCFQNACPVQQ